MQKTTLYLADDQAIALKHFAKRTGRRRADVIREAVADYLTRQPEPPLPSSIGSGHDGKLSGTDSEKWLEQNWRPEATWRAE